MGNKDFYLQAKQAPKTVRQGQGRHLATGIIS